MKSRLIRPDVQANGTWSGAERGETGIPSNGRADSKRCRADPRRVVSDKRRRSAERARSAERGDALRRDIEHIAQHRVGIGAEAWCGAGNPPEAGAPRQAGQNADAIRLPKTALAQMMAVDQIARSGKRTCRDAGLAQFLRRGGGPRRRPGGERVVDQLSLLTALGKPEPSERQQGRDNSA